jgi:hypothetical protein
MRTTLNENFSLRYALPECIVTTRRKKFFRLEVV